MTRNSAGCLFKVTLADGVTYVEYANFVMATVGAGATRPGKTAALSVICYLAMPSRHRKRNKSH